MVNWKFNCLSSESKQTVYILKQTFRKLLFNTGGAEYNSYYYTMWVISVLLNNDNQTHRPVKTKNRFFLLENRSFVILIVPRARN